MVGVSTRHHGGVSTRHHGGYSPPATHGGYSPPRYPWWDTRTYLPGTMVGYPYIPCPVPWWPYYSLVYMPGIHSRVHLRPHHAAHVRASAPAHAEVRDGGALGSRVEKPLGEPPCVVKVLKGVTEGGSPLRIVTPVLPSER